MSELHDERSSNRTVFPRTAQLGYAARVKAFEADSEGLPGPDPFESPLWYVSPPAKEIIDFSDPEDVASALRLAGQVIRDEI